MGRQHQSMNEALMSLGSAMCEASAAPGKSTSAKTAGARSEELESS